VSGATSTTMKIRMPRMLAMMPIPPAETTQRAAWSASRRFFGVSRLRPGVEREGWDEVAIGRGYLSFASSSPTIFAGSGMKPSLTTVVCPCCERTNLRYSRTIGSSGLLGALLT
jgi:hypothetical protein